MRPISLTTSAVAFLLLAACAEKDTKAPPAPRVHPVQSPTSASKIVLTGAAEFGSTVTVSGGASTVTVTADPFTAEFLAEVPLHTTIPAGDISVKNSLSVTATDSAGNVSEATPVEVVFGPEKGKPAKLSFALAVDGGTIHAGDTVSYTYSVTDAYGGPVVNPLEVIPSWPQAVVFDDGISGNGQVLGMTRTGDFTVTARATGAVGVVQVAPLTVLPASGKRFIDLALTLSRMATNDTTAALTVVKDLYGNVIIEDTNGTSAGLTLSCTPQNTSTPASACSKAGNLFTITKSGVYKITAAYDDGVNPAASRSDYVFVEDAPDVEPPTAHIDGIIYPGNTVQVPRQGRIDAQLTLTDNRGLATAVLYAVFGNVPACRSNSVTLLLTGATSVTTSASLTLQNCALPLDGIALFVQVTDQAGNQAFSPVNTSLTVSGAQLGNLAGAGGYQVGLFGVSNNLNNGADLAVDGASQTAYVITTSNNNGIRVMLPDRNSNWLNDTTGQNYQGNNTAQGIAIAPGGDLFIGRWNIGSITWIPPSLPTNPASLVTGLFGPSRLVYDARPTTPVVCAAKTSGLQSMNCYGFSSAGGGSLTKQFNTDLIPNPAPGGNNTELAGVAVGAKDASGFYSIYLVYSGCGIYRSPASFDGSQPAVPVAVPVAGGFTAGSTCADVAALPSGDLAVLDTNQRSVIRVNTTANTGAAIATGFSSPTGLDYAAGSVYVLDRNLSNGAIVRISPPTGTTF